MALTLPDFLSAIGPASKGSVSDCRKVLDYIADVLSDATSADLDKLVAVTATAAELNNAADVSARVQALTASGAITAGVQSIELNHATVVIAATIANLALHPGFLMVKNTSASGTAAHTVTAASGTWDGTNDVLTLNAPNEAILVYIDSAGNGTIIENVGSVAIS